MIRRSGCDRLAAALLTLLLASPCRAQLDGGETKPPVEIPKELKTPSPRAAWPVRVMIQELERGMFVRIPVVDTDPNRGVTVGVMPIWVFRGEKETRIRHIHAPSLTYNRFFKTAGTLRYYYYPDPASTLILRGAAAVSGDREILGHYENLDVGDSGLVLESKLHFNEDSAERFFGIGPATDKASESNFMHRTAYYHVLLGLPIFRKSGWKFNVGHRLGGDLLRAGIIETLPDLATLHPRDAPLRAHQSAEANLYVDYDTRDNAVTTSRGGYVKLFHANAQRPFGSEFVYQRWGLDLRGFFRKDFLPSVTATRFRFEQLVGRAPFYLMPSLGGKSIHRAYGAGRYVDQGMVTSSIEERFTVYAFDVTGVSVELEGAPFLELGTVFDTPGRATSKYMRPAAGFALRAIARPQVVGSIDFGVGHEGLSVFMDVNYAF